MNLKDKFKQIRDNYVIGQVKRAKLPDFGEDKIQRCRVLFQGRVQKVGFRLEVCELAKRLNLTGYCKNLDSGEVLAELQGPANKISFLLEFMESLKRIKITNKQVTELEVIAGETGFLKQ